KAYKERSQYLRPVDLKLVSPLIKEFNDIDMHALPHAFVHGDIISTNVIKDTKNKLWIVDFSVANYYPRIVELAVLAVDLLFDKDNKTKSERNLKLALSEYQKKIPLTDEELAILPTFIKFAHAIHLTNSVYYKIVHKNNTTENEHFLELGRAGL